MQLPHHSRATAAQLLLCETQSLVARCTWPRFSILPPVALTRCAVTDRQSGVVIPPYDPVSPEPLSTVNVSVLDAPNARSEGERRPMPP